MFENFSVKYMMNNNLQLAFVFTMEIHIQRGKVFLLKMDAIHADVPMEKLHVPKDCVKIITIKDFIVFSFMNKRLL